MCWAYVDHKMTPIDQKKYQFMATNGYKYDENICLFCGEYAGERRIFFIYMDPYSLHHWIVMHNWNDKAYRNKWIFESGDKARKFANIFEVEERNAQMKDARMIDEIRQLISQLLSHAYM